MQKRKTVSLTGIIIICIRLDDDVAKSQQIISDKSTDKRGIDRIKNNIRKIK